MKLKKFNLLLPIAGKGQRFVNEKFLMPKPLIMVDGRLMIELSLCSINYSECNLIFIVRSEHVTNYSIDSILKQKFGKDIKIVVAEKDTEGSVCSCLLAKDYINDDLPLIIYCPDVRFENQFDPSKIDFSLIDGLILTFKSNNNIYSYAQTEENLNKVIKTAEKSVISNNAAVGVYCFSKGSEFIRYSDSFISKNIRTNNEFYVTPMYNLMIEDDKNIQIKEVEKMYVLGTPEEYNFYLKIINNKFGKGKIGLCCDHSGFELKEKCKGILDFYQLEYIDFGTYVNKNCDQVDYTKLVCKSIQENQCTHGLGFCRTGQAINIVANKFKGIRSALIINEYMAEMAIKHNGVNFFSIASKFVNEDSLAEIIYSLMANTFDGGRHQTRVQKILELDNDK